jgi:hypothetical protein
MTRALTRQKMRASVCQGIMKQMLTGMPEATGRELQKGKITDQGWSSG